MSENILVRRALNFLISPQNLIFKIWGRLPVGSFRLRLDYDVFPRPHYAFCLYHAAVEASRLGVPRISAAEFGVAGGLGLMELERLAEQIEKVVPVKIDVLGFDTGEGLPEPKGYRDLPYIWKSGFYKMDQEALKARLKRSHLVLGDVKDTAPGFFAGEDVAPLAAAFFDLDFWSSTQDVLTIFDVPDAHLLPRVFCYFDDVFGAEDGGLMNEFVGPLAAINDYNDANPLKKIARIAGLPYTRRRSAGWNDKIYVHHDFDHEDYSTYVHSDSDRQLSI